MDLFAIAVIGVVSAVSIIIIITVLICTYLTDAKEVRYAYKKEKLKAKYGIIGPVTSSTDK